MTHPFFKAKGVYFSIEMFDSMKLLHTIRWFICFLSYYLLQNLVVVSLSWVGVARESLVLYFSLKKKKIIRKSVGIRFCPAIFFCIQREKKYLINDFIRKKNNLKLSSRCICIVKPVWNTNIAWINVSHVT